MRVWFLPRFLGTLPYALLPLGALALSGTAVVVPNGIDVRPFVPETPPSHEPRVVFCGVFNYEPNEAGAIWFASKVWPLVPPAQGGGPPLASVWQNPSGPRPGA